MKVYLIGSLRNPEVPKLANQIRELGFEVFDDWYAAGPEADDKWRDYEKARGHTFKEALKGYAANHVYQFDKKHLKDADIVVLALPAGKSGHSEAMWAACNGKICYILVDSPERWDVMYLLYVDECKKNQNIVICDNFDELEKELKILKDQPKESDKNPIDPDQPFLALNPVLKVVASGNSAEEAKLKARAAGCPVPLIARKDK